MLLQLLDYSQLKIFFLKEFYKKAGALGILGITAKSEYGGSDGGYLDHCM